MITGIVGRKLGMSRIFTEDGDSIPVTVVEVKPNKVTQIKTEVSDGYTAVQVTTGIKKRNRLNKSEQGHFAKAGVDAGRGLWEFLVDLENIENIKLGQEFTVDQFAETKFVDVSGKSKGKGFQGAIKRWNFRTQDNSHGNSLSHRAPGSIGQNQTPGRVFKGKKMAGQMGNKNVTTQSLELVRIDSERELLIIKGAVPGSSGSDVIIRFSVKR